MVLVSYLPINTIVLAGLLVMVMHFLHAGSKCATLPETEESMTATIEFITALFCQVDDQLSGFPTHPEAGRVLDLDFHPYMWHATSLIWREMPWS